MARLFWIILAVVGGGLILLIVNHDAGSTLGLENDAFARTLYLGAWGVVVAAALAGSRIPLGIMARNIAIWLFIAFVLIAGYAYRFELQDFASRVTAGLMPGNPISIESQDDIAVILEKRASGHFEVRGMVDGATVDFLIDTGATTTVLTVEDARRAGIDPARLAFDVPIMTANGEARAARASAGEIRIGAIARRQVPLLVTEEGRLGQSLLGMNFLGTLAGIDMRGDRLVLRD